MNLAFLPRRVGKILSDVGKGNVIVLRRVLAADYNPHEAGFAEGQIVEYPCDGVLMQPRRRRKKDGSEQDESCRVLLRADTLPVIPEIGDTLVINGENWTIVQNSPVKPAGACIMHKVEVRP